MARGKQRTPYTSRTLKWMNENFDLEAGMVERRVGNPKMPTFTHKRVDLFGVIDIIGMPRKDPSRGIFGIQSTSYAALKPHIDKAEAEPRLKQWLAAGARYLIVTWQKQKLNKDSDVVRWRPRIYEVTLSPRGKLRTQEVTGILE